VRDEFGIVSEASARRVRFGNRMSHGKVAVPPPTTAIKTQAPKPVAMTTAATIERQIADVLAKAGVTHIECKAQGSAPPVTRHLMMRQLVDVVSDASGVSVKDLLSPRRARQLARPRQVLMWLARKHTPYSLPEIGRSIGNRDHTTVMHADRVIGRLLIEGQPDIRELVENCERTINDLCKKATG
jgi:chromosomal replication initiation ATPase DnaA